MTVFCPICRSKVDIDDAEQGDDAEIQCGLCDEVFRLSDASSVGADADDDDDGELDIPLIDDANGTGRRSSEAPLSTGQVPRILVAHDSHSFCRRARELLEDEGFVVEIVYDGSSAESALTKAVPPRLAVIDAMLPGRLGAALAADLKKDDSPVRIILVSGIYERYRLRQESNPAYAPDGFVDPRNIDRELLPVVRKLTGIGAGALAPRPRTVQTPERAREAVVPSEPAEELPSLSKDQVSIDDLEDQLRGLLEDDDDVAHPAEFDDDEDREIWEKILAEEDGDDDEYEDDFEDEDVSESFDLDTAAAVPQDPEVFEESLAQEQTPTDEPVVTGAVADGAFDPGDFLVDDEDREEASGETDHESFGIPGDEPSDLTGGVIPGGDPGLGPPTTDDSLKIPLDMEPEGLEADGQVAVSGEDILKLDDLDFEDDEDDEDESAFQTPATVDERSVPAEAERSVSEFEIPVIDDEVELSQASAEHGVVQPTPLAEDDSGPAVIPSVDDEDELIAALDTRLVPMEEAETDELPETDSGEQNALLDGLPPELREAHQKAERLARIIVSDIVLYNQDRIAEAIQNDSFYETLRGDIKDGREFFEEKVPAEVRQVRDYLAEMLENLIADKRKELGLSG